jgi:glutathione S-transferase
VTTLYQFPISHYCAKARWALEYKGIDYRITNLIPGPHISTLRKIAPGTIVPLLIDGDDTIQGSDAIITYLDKKQAHPALTPTTTADASMAHEWERYADTNVGVPLRLFFYFHVLQDRKLAIALLTEDGPWWAGTLYQFIFPIVRKRMRAVMRIDADNAKATEAKLGVAFDSIEQRLEKHKFLAGPLFSRADLSVSALLAPTWLMTAPLPEPLNAFIATHRDRPLFEWARRIYDDYRNIEKQA